MLHVFLPDIEVTETDNPLHNETINLAAKLNMSNRQRLLQIKNPQQVSQAMIGSLRGLTVNSSVTMAWILGQRSKPQDIKNFGKRLQSTTWIGSILEAALGPIRPLDKASQAAMEAKEMRLQNNLKKSPKRTARRAINKTSRSRTGLIMG
jgi:hypothetical protein